MAGPNIWERRPSRRAVLRTAVRFAPLVPAAPLIAACARPVDADRNKDNSQLKSETENIKALSVRIPLVGPDSDTPPRFTGGPHVDLSYANQSTVRNSVDFSSDIPLSAADPKLSEWRVSPVATGTIRAIGSELNPPELGKGVLQIEHPIDEKSGIITTYRHVQVREDLKQQQKVTADTDLGHIAALGTDSPHLHISFERYHRNGQNVVITPLAASEVTIEGYKIKEGETEYNGVLQKGKEVITADKGILLGRKPGERTNYIATGRKLDTPPSTAKEPPKSATVFENISGTKTATTQSAKDIPKSGEKPAAAKETKPRLTEEQTNAMLGFESLFRNEQKKPGAHLVAKMTTDDPEILAASWIYKSVDGLSVGDIQINRSSYSITTTPEPITPADKANFVQWRGKVKIAFAYKARFGKPLYKTPDNRYFPLKGSLEKAKGIIPQSKKNFPAEWQNGEFNFPMEKKGEMWGEKFPENQVVFPIGKINFTEFECGVFQTPVNGCEPLIVEGPQAQALIAYTE